MANEELIITTAPLDEAMKNLLINFPSRDLPKFVDQQFRGIQSEIIRYTPPGSKSVQGGEAKKRGDAALTRDIMKVFVPVPVKGAPKNVDLKMEHQSRRGRGGRVSGRGEGKYGVIVAHSRLTAYVKERVKKVGNLASGWSAGGSLWGIPMQAWQKRGTGRGSAQKIADENRILAKSQNFVSYAPNVGMQKLANLAVRIQANKVNRRLKFLLLNSAKRIGFQTVGS